MINITRTIAVCAALAGVTGPCTAGASPTLRMDGQLPMYPGATLDPQESGMPATAIAQGVPLVIYTKDALKRVDAWYAANAPKACARTAQAGAVKYACPGGSIMIYVKGSTSVALIPAFPGM